MALLDATSISSISVIIETQVGEESLAGNLSKRLNEAGIARGKTSVLHYYKILRSKKKVADQSAR